MRINSFLFHGAAGMLTNFVASILFAGLTALSLILVSVVKTVGATAQVGDVLVILAGAAAMSALLTFQTFLDRGRGRRWLSSRVTFNAVLVSNIIASVPAALRGPAVTLSGSSSSEARVELAVELTAAQLIATDKPLALAKLRLDLEGELRRIAFDAKIDLMSRPSGVMTVARVLAQAEVIPPAYLNALNEIIKVCNSGIHGEEVPEATAIEVVALGTQLLEQLRGLLGRRADMVARR